MNILDIAKTNKMSPSKNIIRQKYLDQIEPFMKKSVIKVLTGQRRVGKSYLLYQIIDKIRSTESDANIIYINKENFEFDFIRDALSLNNYVVSKCSETRRNYIFIDEIQDIIEFEKALRSLLLPEYNDIYITGSNAKLLSGELATLLSGRYIEIEVFSLSYPEFLLFHQLPDNEESMAKFAKFGGLPFLINLPLEDEVVFEYLRNIYSTILYRDVVSRYNLRNSDFLERLVRFIAGNTGSIFSAKSISDFLKAQSIAIPVNQIQILVSHLASAFLIHRVHRFDLVGKRVFSVGEKYFFENLGIRNAIVGFQLQDSAKILENIVYNHLIFMGYNVRTGSLGPYEIDFVVEKNAEKVYLQVALKLKDETTILREFGNLLKIQDNYPKFVVTSEQFSGNTYEGVRHLNIRDFLMMSHL
jgi:uncharacterized protein